MPTHARLPWLPSLRAHLGLALLLAVGVQRAWASCPPDLLSKLFHPEALRRDLAQHEITLFEAGFAPLRPGLPAHGDIGYHSSVPPERLFHEGDVRIYYLTQYALAPLRVLNERRLPRVVSPSAGDRPASSSAFVPLTGSLLGPELYQVAP